MAAGEYTSVASQRELVEAELDVERRELRKHPTDEMEELAALYESRGVEPGLAREVARQLSRDPEQALEIHAREELGIDPDDLPSPTVAAVSSLRLLRAGRAAARTAVSARRDRPVARGAARAGRALRLRRGGGQGDGAVSWWYSGLRQLVLGGWPPRSRTAWAPVRCGRRLTVPAAHACDRHV